MKPHSISVCVICFVFIILLSSKYVLRGIFSELSDFEQKLSERILEDLETKKIDTEEDMSAWMNRIGGSQQNKVYSQGGEDGIIDTIFEQIGTTDKIYVEFGVEDCTQCNSRYLREYKGWDVNNSLLMDGGHSNPDINLKQVIFWPHNIVCLFATFQVKKKFDFLSVDTDSPDFFILEAILAAGYRPRVIAIEINASFDYEDAKTILPPEDGKTWERHDGTTYHGVSIRGAYYLFNRFNYSMVFCNHVNCFAVSDEAMGLYVRRPISEMFVQNYDGWGHKCDYANRSMAVIAESGRWLGETDEGRGSSRIRTNCVAGVPDKKPYIEDVPQAETKIC